MQLGPSVARRPAGLALKPLKPIAPAAKAMIPNRASSYGLRPLLPGRISNSSPRRPAPCSVHGMGRGSCPAPRTKAHDEAEREPQAPTEKQGEEAAAAERKTGERSMAYQLFAALYVCAYVFCWRTRELIVGNAQEALERLRRYVRDNSFNRKR